MSDSTPNFEGHADSECGEHRTVGPHRAWCYNDTEWCYPHAPCRGCELPILRAVADAAQAIYHQHHTDEGLLPEDLEWPALGAALKRWEVMSR